MTMNSNDPREALTPGDRESNAAGEAEDSVPAIEPDDIVTLWADAKACYLARVFPRYGSPAWIDLEPDDPRRLASALYAAEMWRRYGDEDALMEWFLSASRPRPPLAEGLSRAELDELAKPKPPHQLQATPGWPPIRIPGKPGEYLVCTRKEAA